MDWKQLLASTTRSVEEELRLRNAYLAVENRILRNQIAGRVQLTDAERKTLAEIGQKLGKKALEEVATIAQPETILAWQRTRIPPTGDSALPRKSVGRPRIDPVVEALVVRMARENRSWGYDSMVGALHNLGYTMSDQTVGNILKRHSIPPAPERKRTTTWSEFIRMHMAILGATEFFSSAVWSGLRLLDFSVLSFLHGGLCKDSVAGMTFLCHGGWLRLLSLRSSHGQRDPERRGWLGRAEAPSQRLRLDARLLQPLFDAWKISDGRAHPPHSRERMVLMPAANRHRRRDGPLRCRQRCSALWSDDNREAA